jgi:uroporphyrin-III C-methyltransferase/precorrin-2 dehydrogenase/sirohydrochlorin ferrochelatase
MFVPVFLRLEGRRVLVVGGGAIAARKAAELARAGAKVTLVAPRRDGEAEIDGVVWIERAFEPSDVKGVWLVVAATDDPRAQREIAQRAEEERTFVIAVDDLANASAISPGVVRRGAVTIAISSGGEAPALTRLLREIVEQILPGRSRARAPREVEARGQADAVALRRAGRGALRGDEANRTSPFVIGRSSAGDRGASRPS